MKNLIKRYLSLYLAWLMLFAMQKPVFMALYSRFAAHCSADDWIDVVWHGLAMDASTAGYFTALPALLLVIEAALGERTKLVDSVCRIWLAFTSMLFSSTFLLNILLYNYWHFPLDATPIFYFTTSPASAMASAEWWQIVAGSISLFAMGCGVYILTSRLMLGSKEYKQRNVKQRAVSTGVMLLLAASLFLPIRGGVTVSTMNTGHAYYSEEMLFNHAAVNPFFSLMESYLKAEDFGRKYRFMSENEAAEIFNEMRDYSTPENIRLEGRPNILFIVLESFSSKLLTATGGEAGIAVNLDSVARRGVLFSNFYANSFRTDRGLVSILSGFPAQPTMSIMKYSRKTENIPSIYRTLKREGYEATYYYGGDANFTNMRSYLTSQGITQIVSDPDFSETLRRGKWGIEDGPLFKRVLADMDEKSEKPFFRVVQTSSSHEPFEVPYHRLENKRLNAFAYTDSIVGDFLDKFADKPEWDNTLIVLVPDHLGCYPEDIDMLSLEHQQIPLILTGGVIKQPARINTTGSQQDIAATLLAAMGIDHSEFKFSKDMLSSSAPHFAFFTLPDAVGLVSDSSAVIYDNAGKRVVLGDENKDKDMLRKAKAYLQSLYNVISKL